MPRTALLIIDVINDLQFPNADQLYVWARRMTPRLLSLRRRARAAGLPVIYVNDNFGLWHSDVRQIIAHCSRPARLGRTMVQRLKPGRGDYFIVKPRHSAFFATSLKPLLEDLGVTRLILTGIATNLCVFFSAHDAHMHGFKLIVASDCCAAETDFDHDVALGQLERFCRAKILRGDQISLPTGRRRRQSGR